MLRSFLQSQMDLPLYIMGLLFTALVFQLTSITGTNLPSDDEFAEFEDPDDTFIVDLADPPSKMSKHPPTTQHTSASDGVNESGGDSTNEEHTAQGHHTLQETDEEDTFVIKKPLPNHVASLKEDEMEEQDEATVTSKETDEQLALRDDEEFEGLSPIAKAPLNPTSKTSGSKNQQPELVMTQVPRHLTGSWDSYYMEILIICALVVYFCNYVIGRATNTHLASAWFEAHKPLLETQFAMVGDDGQADTSCSTGHLIKESEHLYSLWCTGRVFCEAMLIELRLLKRQCLLFQVANIFRPINDTIVAKVIMEDAEMDGWVLAVGRKRRLQILAKDHLDLAFFCPDKRGQRHPSLPESLMVLSEIPEATTSMLNAPICKFLSENEHSIEYLFFSDQYSGPKPSPEETSTSQLLTTEKVLIFSFRVGHKGTVSAEHMVATTPLFQFIFYVIDKVRRLRLTKEAKIKSERNRQRAYETRLKCVHLQRQEAAQSRREERLRANKERIMTEDDPDKARKLEEREQRKERARKMPKIKMLKSKGM